VNIAIVKLSSLGDVIHALPVLGALRAARPEARLTWIVELRESAILRDHPELDAVIPVDTRRWRGMLLSPRGLARVGRDLRDLRGLMQQARFDVAIDLQGLIKSGLLTALTGAPLRIGFAATRCWEPLNALFTNRRVRPPTGARHVIDQYRSLLAPLGVSAGAVSFRIPTSAAAEARMDEFFAAQGLTPRDHVVALCPGARRPNKRWPVHHFRTLADRLSGDTGARALVVWGPGERDLARGIATGLWSRPVLAPPTDLDELGALLRRCSVLIAGDTGPLHLAAAVGTPAVGLFGPTPAERNRPWGPRGRGLQSPDGLMASIAPDAVLDTAVEFL
jgi:lipopolysaccharide heptosyltransferase I